MVGVHRSEVFGDGAGFVEARGGTSSLTVECSSDGGDAVGGVEVEGVGDWGGEGEGEGGEGEKEDKRAGEHCDVEFCGSFGMALVGSVDYNLTTMRGWEVQFME